MQYFYFILFELFFYNRMFPGLGIVYVCGGMMVIKMWHLEAIQSHIVSTLIV